MFDEGSQYAGNGFQACLPKGSTARRQGVIYQRCLAIEMEKQGLKFLREEEMPIYYDDRAVGTRRADFIVEDRVLVELKATIRLEEVHLAQGLNYLEAYKVEKGLLINFGAPSLEVKRLFRKSTHAINDNTTSCESINPDHPDSHI
jgi:GxxExxY protein